MKIFLIVTLLIFFVALQLIVVPHLTFHGVRPDIFLLALLTWFLLRPFRESMFWLLAGGFLLDLYSPLPFGVISLSMYGVLLVFWLFPLKVFTQMSKGYFFLAAIVGSILYNLFLNFWLWLFGRLHLTDWHIDPKHFLWTLLPIIVFNFCSMYLIVRFLRYLNKQMIKFERHALGWFWA